jgi:hypothetical protein
MSARRPSAQNPGPDALVPGGQHFEHHPAVIDQYAVTGHDVIGQARIRDGDLLAVPGHGLAGDGELTARLQPDGTGGEGAETDLGSLQVDEHADTASGLVRDGPHGLVRLQVAGLGAVAHVEPRHVEPGRHQFGDLPWAAAGRAQRAHDLGSAAHRTPSSLIGIDHMV